MKSTKYQLLKDDFDLLAKEVKLYRGRIDYLEKENKQLRSTVKIDRFEYKELFDRYCKVKEENECLRDELAIAKGEI
jgi:predicted nuclease with TOPRIM domain